MKALKSEKWTIQELNKEFGRYLVDRESDTNHIFDYTFILVEEFESDKTLYQVSFSPIQSYENNYYYIFCNNVGGGDIFTCCSQAKYPPVWNREFGLMDYYDYLSIQKNLYDWCCKQGENFTINTSPKNRWFYLVDAPLKEIDRRIQNGESYQITSVPADKEPRAVQHALSFFDL